LYHPKINFAAEVSPNFALTSHFHHAHSKVSLTKNYKVSVCIGYTIF